MVGQFKPLPILGLTVPGRCVHAELPDPEVFERGILLHCETLTDASVPMPKDGSIELPTKPGLGLDLDEAALTWMPFAWKSPRMLRSL